jgi:hypothetical protein
MPASRKKTTRTIKAKAPSPTPAIPDAQDDGRGRLVEPYDPNPATVSAFLESAEAMMDLAANLFCRPFPDRLSKSEKTMMRYKVSMQVAPQVGKAKGSLYTNAAIALRELVAAGVPYADAERRVGVIVGICNTFIQWCKYRIGRAPAMPDPEKEPKKSDPVWTEWQAEQMPAETC